MSQPHPEWLILAVALIALALAPVASRLVRQVGDQISGGAPREPGAPAVEVGASDDLREEVRQIVVAANERRERMGEPLVDVDAEVERRMAKYNRPYDEFWGG